MTDTLPPAVLAALTQIGIVLAHFVWQGTTIAVLLALMLPLLRKHSPSARYTTLVTGLMLMAVSPMLTLCYVAWQQPPVTHRVAAPTWPIVSTEPRATELPNEAIPVLSPPLAVTDAAVVEAPAEQPSTQLAPIQPQRNPGPRPNLSTLLTGQRLEQAFSAAAALWVCGVLVLAARLTFGWLGLYRLRRRGTEPLPAQDAALVQQLCNRLGLANVRVFATRVWSEPVAFGLLRPVVLMPVSVLTQCPPELIEAVIAHELAHIRRHDLWINLLQRVVETLLFYHPAVWWVSRRIRAERELCCDDLAVSLTQKRADYASALVEISRLARGLSAPPLAAGLVGSRLSIVDRARRVLRMTSAPSQLPRMSFWIAGPLALVLAGTIGLFAVSSSAASSPGRPAVDKTAEKAPVSPPEEKAYLFKWHNTPFRDALDEFARMSGLSVRGLAQIAEGPTPSDITFESARPLNFDDALLLFNRLIEADEWWVVRRDDFLDIKVLPQYYREIPPTHVFTSVQAYRHANLPGWEWATVFYNPQAQPASTLCTFVMDNIPDNRARAATADYDRVELKGIVYYINQQLDLLERVDVPPPASMPAPGSHRSRMQQASPAPMTAVRSLADGIVLKVLVKDGQEVQAGVPLIQLDDEEIKLELQAAQSRVAAAMEAMKSATQRTTAGLAGPGEQQKAEQDVAMAEIDVQRWKLRLSRTQICAPLAGEVILSSEIGNGSKIEAGDTVAEIIPSEAGKNAPKDGSARTQPARPAGPVPHGLRAPGAPGASPPRLDFAPPDAPSSPPPRKSRNDQTVRSSADGIIAKVHVKPGQQVKQGELLSELDNEEIKIELQAAKVRLEAAVKQQKTSTLQHEKGLAPTGDKLQADTNARLAELEIQRLELRVSRTQLRAPVAGEVVVRSAEGTKVSAGDIVAEIRPAATQPATQADL